MIALAAAATIPLSRRAARQRQAGVPPVPTAPDEPFIAAATPVVADVPAAPVVAEIVEKDADTVPAEDIAPASEPFVAEADADGDAFERASRAFRRTGPIPTASTTRSATSAPKIDTAALTAVGPRRTRSIRKVLTAGATVGAMGLAGLLAVSMTMPAEAVAAAQNGSASTSLVTAAAADAAGGAEEEIQAFVAPSGVQNEPLSRADNFSTVSLVEVAAEQGINYSGEIFTNDPDAAIQWPFLVGVGMSYGYGMRSGRLHEGIDFVPGNGAPIQAIADGTVRIATEQGGAYGVTVYIDHVIDGSVITSHYSHMQYGSLQVKAGDTVKVGDIVGKTGNTGRSYGAHLHFELIVNGTTIDPMPWLKKNAGRTSLTSEE
ncbi:peptidoglycan DD-metalloendopeptidase family protein [Microbacterium sp. BLY]|uniref:peptidoglycan DD-metalloendopeptidase family protein n=1 Tax=Microbacterium sp. BLY TaxID=2823280 RepID=UPI0027DB990A|nr:peptidoglycan DD-metalloendopeptidase family protein [Microbacterium sp. BLY]